MKKKKKLNVLGVHIGHDSSAALIKDGEIVANAAEERFVRVKHYAGMPTEAIEFCLKKGNLEMDDIDIIAYSGPIGNVDFKILFNLNDSEWFEFIKTNESPLTNIRMVKRRLSRMLKREYTYKGMPDYLKSFTKSPNTLIMKVDHHMAHAASAYYTSGCAEKCLVITCDGIGDNNSMVIWLGQRGKLKPIRKFGADGSLGWFYGLITEGLGWWVGDGEGKTMGLAPYGKFNKDLYDILSKFAPKYEKGTLKRGVDFGIPKHCQILGAIHWHFKDSVKIRHYVEKFGKEDVAANAQVLLEDRMLDFINYWINTLQVSHLCAAGGVFLNVKLNQKILEIEGIEDFWIYPDGGDGGLAVGAALLAYYQYTGETIIPQIKNVYWGPDYDNDYIESLLKERGLRYEKVDDPAIKAGDLLAEGKIIGWFQGRMETGPRALGNRSILFDPRKAENKDIINNRVKYREPFRPFCPSILVEYSKEYFKHNRDERYMIVAYDIKNTMADKIPAVVHVDNTVRPQFVHKSENPRYWQLIERFREKTGVPVILNTSFNIKGEPIVCSPRDAIKCFFDTGIDILVMEDLIVYK